MITVLLSTYNGEKFLDQQLGSLFSQIDVEMSILVRDDSSSDSTKSILKKYEKEGKLSWYTGDNLGPAKSFMDLLYNAPDSDYYAFCDQDDVWEIDKLKSSIDILMQSSEEPSLYFSQTQLVDEYLNPMLTNKITLKCTFSESLIVTYASGCTFVFNKKLLDLVRYYRPIYISMHDYWIYRICLAVNGNIYFDHLPHILYRQHGNNAVGGDTKIDFFKLLKLRLQRTVFHPSHERLFTCKELLDGYGSIMPIDNKRLLESVTSYKLSVFKRLKLLFDNRFTTGNFKRDICFKFAVLIGSY